MEPVRIYADTSVFGGCFDAEFKRSSETLVNQVRAGRLHLLSSAVVIAELQGASDQVRRLFDSLMTQTTIVDVTPAAIELQQAYVTADVVSSRWMTDALHVAVATTSRCNAIVSWNFKHIVHLNRIARYNQVNSALGHAPIAILSPPEVIAYDEP